MDKCVGECVRFMCEGGCDNTVRIVGESESEVVRVVMVIMCV